MRSTIVGKEIHGSKAKQRDAQGNASLPLASGSALASLPRCFGLDGGLWLFLLFRLNGLLFFVALTSLAELIHTLVIDLVFPALVNPDEEDNVITEGGEPMEPWHLNGKGKQIINERIEELVC